MADGEGVHGFKKIRVKRAKPFFVVLVIHKDYLLKIKVVKGL